MGYGGKKVGTWGVGNFENRRPGPNFRADQICVAPITIFAPMDLAQQTSPSTLLSSLLSLYLLSEPPSPSSALPTIVTLIAEKNPFKAIEANSPAFHKWNTRVSSLIQSKSAESRFWGVCLVKASIESGGEGVGHVIVWSKLLLTLLNVRGIECVN